MTGTGEGGTGAAATSDDAAKDTEDAGEAAGVTPSGPSASPSLAEKEEREAAIVADLATEWRSEKESSAVDESTTDSSVDPKE